MAKQKYFDKFLSNIEPSQTTVNSISSIQTNIRSYLKNHERYKDIHVDTFLSGSYAKHTSIRPVKCDKKRDVDIIVVTSYDSTKDSKEVLEELRDVLIEKDIYDNADLQSHSVGVEMADLSVDIVPVIVDSQDGKLYYVADLNNGEWIKTDPKGHKTWSTNVNQDANNKYKPLVKIFKWWRRVNCIGDLKYPKGITLEKMIADNLGDSSLSIEEFLIETIENIVVKYKDDSVSNGENPVIDDPSDKINNNDLLSGYSVDDFAEFITKLEEHADLLNTEGTVNDTWRKILGTEFPKAEVVNHSYAIANIQKCITAPHKQIPTWPMQRGGAAFISLKVTDPNGNFVEYENNGAPLDKGLDLTFKACTGVKRPYSVMWQIVNTGEEARQNGCLRGNFEKSDLGYYIKKEKTEYQGSHSIQCFVIKNKVCVAKSKEFIINIK